MSEAFLIESRRFRPGEAEGFNVFAYGSLMWRPGFPFASVRPATLFGYHRAFCIRSIEYRGTPENPGLVLGLDRGGMCHGRVFSIAAEQATAVADYLHEREMNTACYIPRQVKLRLEDGERPIALAYVADRRHPQYAGKLAPAEIAARIAGAAGSMGSNLDYLRNTIAHLEEMGIHECSLHSLLRVLGGGMKSADPSASSSRRDAERARG